MTNENDDDAIFSALRALPTAPPAQALSARVLERAQAALAEGGATSRSGPGGRAATWAVGSAVVAAVAVYLSWVVNFLTRLADG